MNFPGLHVTTLDCQKDGERMGQMKEEQRTCKQAQGNQITFLQQSRLSSLSISSSDEGELYERSGESSRRRSHLAQRVHDIRIVLNIGISLGANERRRWASLTGIA